MSVLPSDSWVSFECVTSMGVLFSEVPNAMMCIKLYVSFLLYIITLTLTFSVCVSHIIVLQFVITGILERKDKRTTSTLS